MREEINSAEAEALRDAAERVLRGETVGSIIRPPVVFRGWNSIGRARVLNTVGALVSPGL